MMLVCPACDSRYMVGDDAIPAQGRKVRCANCGHEWFQEGQGGDSAEDFPNLADMPELNSPEIEDEVTLPALSNEEDDISISGDAEEDIPLTPQSDGLDAAPFEDEGEAIPEAVKPIPDNVINRQDSPRPDKKDVSAKLAGYGAAAGIFLCMIGLMIALKGPNFSAFPASALLYNLFGLELTMPGQGIVIEKLAARVEGGNMIVTGRIINLKDKDQDVPLLLAVLKTESGEDLESWVIDPPFQVLTGEESFDFEAVYPQVPENAVSVNVQFAPFMERKAQVQDEPDMSSSSPSPHSGGRGQGDLGAQAP